MYSDSAVNTRMGTLLLVLVVPLKLQELIKDPGSLEEEKERVPAFIERVRDLWILFFQA